MDHGPKDHFDGSHYHAHRATGPFSFLHPTKRYISLPKPDAKPASTSAEQSAAAVQRDEDQHQHHVYHVWRSRDNRKGRHAVVVSPEYLEKVGSAGPKPTNSYSQVMSGLVKMVIRYPIWDVSYDVATIFTWGSVIWVINGFFEWLPLQAPSTEFNNEVSLGGPITAFIGATVFEIGSVLLMLEAVNENRSDCFGWALEEAWESSTFLPLTQTHDDCNHHHKNKSAWLKRRREDPKPSPSSSSAAAASASDSAVETSPPSPSAPPQQNGAGPDGKQQRRWSWWPSWYELRTHYFRDIGFLACASQMFGASIFWISGLTGLPPILNALSIPASNGIFWLPQVIGGMGFVVSSTFFMLEVQEKWWKPAPHMLGWHIGFWNLIGAIGFTLCGALGFAINDDNIAYASTLATFIGSWAFLIGSVVQWYESLDKYPVSVVDHLAQLHEESKAKGAATAA